MIKKLFTHDFRHTAINQLWRLFSGPAILILIPLYLSADAQGYWFTFVSLAALAVFADLGFTTIILQFSAYEFAYLRFDKHRQIMGDEYYIKRISSLFRYALHWSFKVSILAFPLILIIGYTILSQKEIDIEWTLPWIIYSLGSILIFVNNIILSFIEGCNSVGDVQKIRFRISVVNITLMALGLFENLELFALAFSMVGSASVGMIVIFRKYGRMLKQLYNIKAEDKYDWKKEILPLLGKYAISWASGYFIFSIFTPLTFHYYGVIEAGKVGLSIALWTAVFGISNIWMIIIMPKINMLVSRGDYEALEPIFYRHLRLSIGTFVFSATMVFGLYFLLEGRFEIVNRFVSPWSMFILGICWLTQVIVNALAVYMRAHKQEPLVIPSFIGCIYISGTTFFIALLLPFEYLFLGFLSSYLFIVPWVLIIFQKYKGGKNGSE